MIVLPLCAVRRHSSVVEHFHGKEGVPSSSLGVGSIFKEAFMAEPKKLYKDPNNRVISGVCAGFAEYANLDVSIVRILTVLVALMLGGIGGVILYVVAVIIIPDKPKDEKVKEVDS